MTTLSPVPDQHALARMGAAVRARLEGDPAVYAVPNGKVDLFAIGGFLTPEECTRLCTMLDAVACPSALHELDYASGFRTS